MEKYQTFGRRVGAAFLDSIILVPINGGISLFLAVAGLHLSTLSVALPALISGMYYVLMHYHRGQTLGKMAMRVKVLDDSETPINFGQSILRSLPQLLPFMFAVSFSTADESAAESFTIWYSVISGFTGVFFVANVIVCLASEKRRALHDFMAGTIVVRTDV